MLGLEENRASLVVVKSRIDSVEMRYLKSIWNFTLFVKDIEESSSSSSAAAAASSKVWRFVLYVVVFVVVG